MPAIDVITEQDVADRLSPVLRQFAKPIFSARKWLAALIGRHPDTIKHYVEGRREPKLHEFATLAIQCPALADELMAMIEERRRQRQADANPTNQT